MLADFHVHTTFCDGKNTPQQIVEAAIERGMDVIGLSGHGYTPFDLRYCMKDTDGYCAEVNRLREQYKNHIRVCLGVEEDAFAPVNRAQFDYIIGSCHYLNRDGRYLPFDSSYQHFKDCYQAFDGDVLAMAEGYYSAFAAYIRARRPDVIGHFDDITKFDEMDDSLFLKNPAYCRIAERFAEEVARSGCMVEVNTGAIARGYRTTPYPSEHLLSVFKKKGVRLVLSSDSHRVETLAFWFDEAKAYLYDMGFRYLYLPTGCGAEKYSIG